VYCMRHLRFAFTVPLALLASALYLAVGIAQPAHAEAVPFDLRYSTVDRAALSDIARDLGGVLAAYSRAPWDAYELGGIEIGVEGGWAFMSDKMDAAYAGSSAPNFAHTRMRIMFGLPLDLDVSLHGGVMTDLTNEDRFEALALSIAEGQIGADDPALNQLPPQLRNEVESGLVPEFDPGLWWFLGGDVSYAIVRDEGATQSRHRTCKNGT